MSYRCRKPKPTYRQPAPPIAWRHRAPLKCGQRRGVLPLETLASRYPADPRIRRALVLSRSSQRQLQRRPWVSSRGSWLDPVETTWS